MTEYKQPTEFPRGFFSSKESSGEDDDANSDFEMSNPALAKNKTGPRPPNGFSLGGRRETSRAS
jgi:hypothetical protein